MTSDTRTSDTRTSSAKEHYTKINCPDCGAEIDVNNVLETRIRHAEQQKFKAKLAELESNLREKEFAFKQKESDLAQKEADLNEQQAEIGKQVAERTRQEIARREKELVLQISKETEERLHLQYEVRMQSQTEETAELKKQVQESRAAQIENERLKRQMDSLKHDNAVELEKKLRSSEEEYRKKLELQLKEQEETISLREADRQHRKYLELEKKCKDLEKYADEMKRKAEQGSQQLQGEVQELLIEDILRTSFPLDQIAEVKKGVSGADVKQVVRNQVGIESGTILYESKDTKTFQSDWIEKLKTDAEHENADVAVLITRTLPKGIEHLGLINGVWVCSVSAFKGLVFVLRENMIKLAAVRLAQTNKGEKMQMLYDYLTDGKCVEQIRRVVLGFKELQEGYEKEKRAMQKIWNKRDQQLEMMYRNTTDFVTQIQIIAGSSIPLLESPEDELLAVSS